MAKADTTSQKFVQEDKKQKKLINKREKLIVFKDGMVHSVDTFALIHKQTLDSDLEFYDKIKESQESERKSLYEIIKVCDDEIRRKEAYARLAELDRIKGEQINKQREFLQTEREKANKNIAGDILCLAAACGVIVRNKQARKTLTTMGKKLLSIK